MFASCPDSHAHDSHSDCLSRNIRDFREQRSLDIDAQAESNEMLGRHLTVLLPQGALDLVLPRSSRVVIHQQIARVEVDDLLEADRINVGRYKHTQGTRDSDRKK